MKKWKDVSIRVKVMIPIVLMLVMMLGYLVGTVIAARQMLVPAVVCGVIFVLLFLFRLQFLHCPQIVFLD